MQKTLFKVYEVETDNSIFNTSNTVATCSNMLEATLFAKLRKEETGREYYVKYDGIQYYNTGNDNFSSNIMSL